MRNFRLLLSLLLCLTVPVSAWASVLSVPPCDVAAVAHHHHDGAGRAHHADAVADHDGCADHGVPGHPQPDRCGCGCGFGLCASGVSLAAVPWLSVMPPVGREPLPSAAQAAFAESPGASLLRPPIA